MKTLNVNAVAFCLPQWHPIPENDEWWEQGFSVWSNVAKTRSLFPSHYQPHLPANYGVSSSRSAYLIAKALAVQGADLATSILPSK